MIRLICLMVLLIFPGHLMASAAQSYDPLAVGDGDVGSFALEIHDAKRNRTLPVRVYLPETRKPAPIILFSHGLGGSRDNNPYLGNHWAKRGYIVVFIQHPGSDESVWRDIPALQRMAAMKKAVSVENFLLRNGDIPAAIDSLTVWNGEKNHPLENRLDIGHLGMSGHSFGANTTQAVSGQVFMRGTQSYLERRIDASVMMSPGPPAGGDPAVAFSGIRIPCLLMTGTRDDSPIGNQTAADRLKVFPNLNQAPAWQVVFEGATHMDFSERSLVGKAQAEPRYHRAILALTTAFWDMQLKGDAGARSWLNGQGAKSVLLPKDQWGINQRASK